MLENTWQEICERILPMYSGKFFGAKTVEGEKRTEKMLDPTGAMGLERFSAVVEHFVTPRNQKWHGLRHPDPGLMREKNVQLWYEDTTLRLFSHRYAAKSGYANTQSESYISLGSLGTGTFHVEQPNKSEDIGNGVPKGLRYRSRFMGHTYFKRNYAGVIDEAYRAFRLSAKQAAQMFDRDRLPGVITKELEKLASDPSYQGADDEKFEFIHSIRPNRDRDPSKIDHRGMPWVSEYVSREGTVIVEEGGYTTWPYPINRYVTAPEELYGRSPAMLALPSLKTLNAEKEIVLKQGQRTVDPVLLGFDDGIVDTFDMTPGALNPGGITSDGRKLVQTLQDGANIAVGFDLMAMEKQDIKDIFLVTLFDILIDNPQMTATQVLDRAQQRGALIAPTMGRQATDALAPMIERELDLLATQGLLLPPPPELIEDGSFQFEIEYESPLARAQKAEEASGFLRTLEIAMNVAQIKGDPSVLDRFDLDSALPEINWINAGPARWILSDEQVAEIRAERAQQQQLQFAVDAAPAAAGIMKAAQGQK